MDSKNYFAEFDSVDPPYVTEDYELNKLLDVELKKPNPGAEVINLLDISDKDKQEIGLPVSPSGEFKNIFNDNFNPTLKMSTGSKNLELALNKLNVTGVKRNCLIKLAKLESNMNQYAKASNSSASGMFLMIDSTRRLVSSVSKLEFMNNLDELVRAASKLYDKNLAYLKSNGLLEKASAKGLSTDEAIAMTWLNPTWTKSWLNGGGSGGTDANGTGILQYLKMYRNK